MIQPSAIFDLEFLCLRFQDQRRNALTFDRRKKLDLHAAVTGNVVQLSPNFGQGSCFIVGADVMGRLGLKYPSRFPLDNPASDPEFLLRHFALRNAVAIVKSVMRWCVNFGRIDKVVLAATNLELELISRRIDSQTAAQYPRISHEARRSPISRGCYVVAMWLLCGCYEEFIIFQHNINLLKLMVPAG